MVGIEQVRQGAVNYLNREIAPKAEKYIAIGIKAFGPTIVTAKVKQFLGGKLLEGTPLVDGNSVDIDEIYKLYKASAAGEWPITIAGVVFGEEDLDKLYRCVKEAP